MALWDLAGKALGQPVCRMLGGQLHEQVVAMASFIFDMEDFDWTLSEFSWLKEQGYQVVKAGWGMRPEAVFGLDRDKDIDIVIHAPQEDGLIEYWNACIHQLRDGLTHGLGELLRMVAMDHDPDWPPGPQNIHQRGIDT